MITAKVTPIYKSGVKTNCSNYRPISVIFAIAKIFERLVYNQINTFLVETKTISPNQSGFRAVHSTETSLLHITNQCLVNMDKGFINGIFLT